MRTASAAFVLAVGTALSLAPSAAGHSGIRGLVTVSTHCGPDVSGEPPSPPAPLDADVLVRVRATHDLVATVRSGRDGRWRVRLRPGRYLVEPGRAHGGGLAYTGQSPVRVRVRRHHDWPRVDLFYNNGCL